MGELDTNTSQPADENIITNQGQPEITEPTVEAVSSNVASPEVVASETATQPESSEQSVEAEPKPEEPAAEPAPKTDVPEPAPVEPAPANDAGKKPNRLKRIVRSRQFMIIIPLVIIVLVALFAFVNPLKFGLLNLFSSTTVQVVVVDDASLAGVPNATVTIGSQHGTTDTRGQVTLRKVRYGSDAYTIQKEAYTSVAGTANLSLGTNIVGPVKFHSNGVAVNFNVTNTLSNVAVIDYSVTLAGSNVSAQSNKAGMASIKVPANKLGKVTFTVSSTGFNAAIKQATITATPAASPIAVSLTPAGKHYFLSNRSGKIDVYSANLDGTDPTVVIPGTGSEDSSTTLTISPDGLHGALVFKRDGEKAADGSILPALYEVDFGQKTIKRLDDGVPQFNVIGWIDNSHFVYDINKQNYTNPDNTKFKFKTSDLTGQLTTVYSSANQPSYLFYQEEPTHLYYIQSDATVVDYGINSINLSTNKTQRLAETPPDNFAIDHDRPFFISYQVNSNWFSIDEPSQQAQASSAPKNLLIAYTPSPDGKQVAWTESRDGKQSLIVANTDLSGERMVTQDPQATSIVNWSTNDYLTFNSSTADADSDYIVYLPTGVVTKISDVYTAPQGHGGY